MSTATQNDILPYGPGPDGKLHVMTDPASLPEAVVALRLTVEAGVPDVADRLLPSALGEALSRLDAEPPQPAPLFLLGLSYAQMGRPAEARTCFERILARCPHPLVFYELGRLHRETGFPSLATACRRKAVELDPRTAEFRLGLSLDLMREGRIEEGLSRLRAVVAEDPLNADAWSKLLFYLHFLPGVSRKDLFEEHRRWGWIHAPVQPVPWHGGRDRNSDRRLRIGYVSADFRRHSVAYTFEPLLDGHDRDQVEVYGYSNVACPDEVTERLRSKFDVYRDIRRLDDAAAADLIEEDQIDILVAMAGHSGDHRLTVFALKPAPVQVDLGSLCTTGLAQIDYRLTDDTLDPPETQPYYLEKRVPIPDGYVCYRPPDFALPVDPLPALSRPGVTFGSFNNSLKVNAAVVSLWAEVLRQTPGSRLLLKCTAGGDPEWIGRLHRGFGGLGIDPARIEVCGWKSPQEHLGLYGRMDVGLDPHPFNGCLSTLEALWMGVPVVTLTSDVVVSRVGATILARLGMEAVVAATPEAYVAAATRLAANLDVLARIRAGLRARMLASPLCDGRRYARQIEAAYRQMWRTWCEGPSPGEKRQYKAPNCGEPSHG
jgi:protein O-GlcNAc transferase